MDHHAGPSSSSSSAFIRRRPGAGAAGGGRLHGAPLHPPYRAPPSSSYPYTYQQPLLSASISPPGGGGDLMDDGYARIAAGTSRKRTQRGDSFTSLETMRPSHGAGEEEEGVGAGLTSFTSSTGDISHLSQASFHTATSSSSPSLAQGQFGVARDRPSARSSLNQHLVSSHAHAHAQPSEEATAPPARKRRRGLAGTIVDGALNGLMLGAAAGMTAYSLWSSWKSDNSGSANAGAGAGKQQEEDEEEERALEREWGPVRSARGQAPPPAYDDVIVLPGGFASSSKPAQPPSSATCSSPIKSSRRQEGATTSPFVSKPRSRNVYVSSSRHRRRPAFESATARSGSLRSIHDAQAEAETEAEAVSKQQQREGQEEQEEEDEDEDEQYSRFSRQMADLIAQGQAALSSQAQLRDEDMREDAAPALPIGTGAGTGNASPLPSSRSHALPLTPSRIPTYVGAQRAAGTGAGPGSTSTSPAAWRGVGETNLRFGGSGSGASTPPRPSTPSSPAARRRPPSTSSAAPYAFVQGRNRTSSPARGPFADTPSSTSTPAGGASPFVFGSGALGTGMGSPRSKAGARMRNEGRERPVRRAW
ncbi:hypothetical protein BDZ90DRAFT_232781 [Jaminaea rosea]|uniref:Uncharacterized protein n=1 Tax=Jaminaea rosea TaxID=1569628 RepID=A0A316UPP9_9BASI|nr:hypothetical protein BDZ90DRAFT_232781 [Jaminaea rosea]PWN27250.1 hypothetical protein BDZ90DRAFT_232781 [Jaminaea rosea]